MARPHELPKHTSYSAKDTLGRCARSYFLKYFAKAPTRPALWSAGGSAVHEATEKYDRMAVNCVEQAFHVGSVWERFFELQLAKAYAKEPDEFKWGRSQSEPIEVWNQLGPQFIQSYIDWRKRSPWTIWTTPDGEPAIELDVSGKLPGCEIEIKGFVDRIFHDPVFDRLVDLDLKSGKRPPKNGAQFETYTALIKVKYGVDVPLGVPFMNRKGTLGKPYDLSEVTPEAVGAVYGEAWEQVQEYARTGQWPANGYSGECYVCDVQASCAMQNGPLAAQYDPTLVVPF